MLDGGGRFISNAIAAFANFGTQYNFQSIAVALLIMSTNECTSNDDSCKDGRQDKWVTSTASAVIFFGAIVGQLSLGFLGDYFSRNNALAITLSISSVSAFLSAVAPAGNAVSVYAVIILFRFFLGIGLGGVFPISATKASEDSCTESSENKVNSVAASWAFFWQMPGFVAPWLVEYFMTFNTALTVSFKWRFVLGLGCVPLLCSAAILYYEETQRKKDEDVNTTAQSSSPTASVEEPLSLTKVWHLIQQKENIHKLLGSGFTWFLFDIVAYGASLLGGYIIRNITTTDDNISSNTSLRSISSQQMTALVLYTPACIMGIYALPYWGLKFVQVWSFVIMAVCYTILASVFAYCLDTQQKPLLFGIYCITAFSVNLGLGITSFSLPAALFDKKIRATFNGIAAAMGKFGAFVGAFSFPYIAEAVSFELVLGICAGVSIVGAVVSQVYLDQELIALNSSPSMKKASGDIEEIESVQNAMRSP
mmetsp:Transcript_8183/g.12217  ORF Transcript_8183/g.12217 Transcript_8183/m.12217 type:complete len:480 (+) Transcript_8183:43-1482(+)